MAKKKDKNKRSLVVRDAIVTELARSTAASRPVELLEVMGRDTGDGRTRARQMYAEAYDGGENFSTYLERIDPSRDHNGGRTRLDAFGRLVRATGIVPQTDLSRGIMANEFGAFEEHSRGAFALVPELLARMYRRAIYPPVSRGGERGIYLSTDQPSGGVMNPFATAAGPRAPQILAAIPLTELVAFNTGINTNVYKAFYLQTDVQNTRMFRVTEGAEIPGAKLVGSEKAIEIYKFGRKLEVTYETMRRMSIDMVAFHIARIAVQAEADRVAAAMSTIIAGDGNAGTAATVYNLTTLDPTTTANNLTLTAWLTFKMLFNNPYALTTALAQTGPALKLQLLNTGNANLPLVNLGQQFGGFRPINPGLADNVALGWTGDAPANQVVGFDRRFALERVFEIGANIQEVDQWITRQVKVLTMTETEGYATLDPLATKILNLAA